MRLDEAIDLIKPAFSSSGSSRWADLGCGSGLFTKALAEILGPGSAVYAFDREPQVIQHNSKNAIIEFHQLDIVRQTLPLGALDGILMANSLHYVEDKIQFLSKLRDHLKPAGQVIIIEYELLHGNQWVPFPITYNQLEMLLLDLSFSQVRKIGDRKSAFGNHKMYSAVAELQA